jgi:S1-C subfamily serine protease
VARGDLSAEEKATIALFKQSSPSVVFITSLARRRSAWMNVMEIPQGAGSGFIWDRDGHIVTNFHVIQDADAARVTLADQSEWKAALVGGAPDRDLAVLRIAAPKAKLPPLLIGTSRDLQVGQRVFAIGNPFGLDQSLTTGVVSALNRSILSVTGRRIENVIQTDAAINPGNSGGPLLDSAGRLIGVNAQIASTSGSSAGIGFAVPVDTVNQVVPQLIGHGRITRPQLGIQPASDAIQQRLGIEGVLVLTVTEGTGAEKAGLRGTGRAEDGSLVLGDIIQAVDEKKIKDLDDLYGALESHKVGEKVRLRVLRDGKPLTLNVELQPSL